MPVLSTQLIDIARKVNGDWCFRLADPARMWWLHKNPLAGREVRQKSMWTISAKKRLIRPNNQVLRPNFPRLATLFDGGLGNVSR
jgi:hypothetical protein